MQHKDEYQEIFEKLPGGVILYVPSESSIMKTNQQFSEMFGSNF